MRRYRWGRLIVLALLAVLTIPVMQTPHLSAACNDPSCTPIGGTTGGVIGTYASPITVTNVAVSLGEVPLSMASTLSISGTLSFTVLDYRGATTGWVASVNSTGLQSSLFPTESIPGSALSVAGLPTVTLACVQSCSPGVPVASSVGATLDSTPLVAAECPTTAIGLGSYTVEVPLSLTVSGQAAQLLQESPGSWIPSVTVSTDETQDEAYYQALGCSGQPAETTPPTVTCASLDTTWHANDVTVPCTASDAGSGLADPADASFTLSTTVPAGTETDNATTGSRSVCDVAGNCTAAGPISGIKVDEAPPSVSLTTPTSTTYLLHQDVPASYTCSDGGSGVATCSGPVAVGAPIDTASVGTKSFTVTATDNVSNTVSQGPSYQVAYSIHTVAVVTSSGILRTALQLQDAQQNNVSAPSIAVRVTSLDGGPVVPVGPSGPQFRYAPHLGGTGGYVLLVSTQGLSSGLHVLAFTAGADPTVHQVWFRQR